VPKSHSEPQNEHPLDYLVSEIFLDSAYWIGPAEDREEVFFSVPV